MSSAITQQVGQEVAQEVAQLVALTVAAAALWTTLAALWLAGYLLVCRIWPFKACRRCDALGRIHSPGGKAWRTCRKCKGSGQRLRLGRRLWNHHQRAHHDSTT